MDLTDYANTHNFQEISSKVAELAESTDESAVNILRDAFKKRPSDSYTRNGIAPLLGLALLQKGPVGVNALTEILPQADGAVFPLEIISSLWRASKGKIGYKYTFKTMPALPTLLKPLTYQTIDAANQAFTEVILESKSNPDLFTHVLSFIENEISRSITSSVGERNNEDEYQSNGKDFISEILEVFTLGAIKISQILIDDFEKLIAARECEEAYQVFLSSNPVFLDPLADSIISKQKLGIELITDFVTRRLDNRYILVEIEKPQDKIFTANGNFSAKFTHAFGQILDFQQWIDSNSEYARKHMPGISSPKGLLVMGLRTDIDKRCQEKLHRFCVNSVNIDILTFDDLLTTGKCLLKSILKSDKE